MKVCSFIHHVLKAETTRRRDKKTTLFSHFSNPKYVSYCGIIVYIKKTLRNIRLGTQSPTVHFALDRGRPSAAAAPAIAALCGEIDAPIHYHETLITCLSRKFSFGKTFLLQPMLVRNKKQKHFLAAHPDAESVERCLAVPLRVSYLSMARGLPRLRVNAETRKSSRPARSKRCLTER